MCFIFRKKDKEEKPVKYPCRMCHYYHACGDGGRTKPCELRITSKQAKKAGIPKIV